MSEDSDPFDFEEPKFADTVKSISSKTFNFLKKHVITTINAVHLIGHIFPRLIWDIIVIIGAVSLTITWLGFVFGSVIGVVLIVLIDITAFLLPMALMAFCCPLISAEYKKIISN